MKNYQSIARKLEAISNCITSNNAEWQSRHEDAITEIMKTAPSGSGIDAGTQFDFDENLKNPSKLVFTTAYHHMNEGGYYDGWTEHEVTVSASLSHGFSMKISGRDRNEIKEYLHEVYAAWLDSDCEEYPAPLNQVALEHGSVMPE